MLARLLPRRQLVLEIVIVALALALALAAVAAVWPVTTMWRGFATGLILGALFHLGFEIVGLNAMYCRVGHACAI